MVLRNRRTGLVVASVVEPAFDSASRKRGLLGRAGLPAGHALVIAPSNMVHTFFMQFPIDILFVSRDGTVRKVCERVPARRLAGSLGAFAVIEMAAGSVERAPVRAGDTLELADGQPSATSA